jgi:hypothetical protein
VSNDTYDVNAMNIVEYSFLDRNDSDFDMAEYDLEYI